MMRNVRSHAMDCGERPRDYLLDGMSLGEWEINGNNSHSKCQKEALRTVSNIHWFSMMAPQQPKNPTTKTMAPAAMHRAVALRNLKLGAISA